MSDPFKLSRFVAAQDHGDVYRHALTEIRAGEKRSHWMWFVFPQIAGLGRSPMAQRYAIGSIEEAQAYLAHPVLGARLQACVAALLERPAPDAEAIFGSVDAMKLRSSLTLFVRAAPAEPVFARALETLFGGVADQATDARLSATG